MARLFVAYDSFADVGTDDKVLVSTNVGHALR